MRSPLLSVLAAFALLLGPGTPAFALCGDVSGDAKVTSADALRVLRKSVGIDVALICQESEPTFTNSMGFANGLECNGSSVRAHMTWSRHPGLTWSDDTQDSLPFDVGFKRVDDPEVSGLITISFGACGSFVADIDSWGVFFPMPTEGGAWVVPYYQASTNTIFLSLNLAAVDAASLRSGDSSRMGTIIASAPAPKGLSNGVNSADMMNP